jgi:SOS response regulatory protein OraA/RecX
MARNVSRALSFEQGLQRAAALCSQSEHCVADITEKLLRWGISRADSNRIIDRLIDEKYIDDVFDVLKEPDMSQNAQAKPSPFRHWKQ